MQKASGQPLPAPAEVLEWKRRAEAGAGLDEDDAARREADDAYVAWMTAALRMLYPVVTERAGGSPREQLWASILDGRLEGIRLAESLDYARAWEETAGGTRRPPYGGYFDRFCNTAVRSELARFFAGE
ncbi:MAG: hypothetical protein IJJ28_08320 [Lentisphaeria bacterium]|nr:hypothetical protein [Lentisphaeria bacterium]